MTLWNRQPLGALAVVHRGSLSSRQVGIEASGRVLLDFGGLVGDRGGFFAHGDGRPWRLRKEVRPLSPRRGFEERMEVGGVALELADSALELLALALETADSDPRDSRGLTPRRGA